MNRSHLNLTSIVILLTACATTLTEPERFNVELISFQASELTAGADILYEMPGYRLKFRRDAITNFPNNSDLTSYNFVLIDYDSEEHLFQSSWVTTLKQSGDSSAVYEARFYSDSFNRSDVPNSLCARILIGNGKKGTKVKRPVLISNKIQFEFPE